MPTFGSLVSGWTWRPRLLVCALLLILSPLLLVTGSASAETSRVVGESGPNGQDGQGEVGPLPAQPGGDGADGAAATATADAVGEANSAFAFGGRGGAGGRGGHANRFNGGDGGDGGNGGDGGDATAIATTVGERMVEARARGGDAGRPAAGGSGSNTGNPGRDGERGGIGGNASASAFVEREFDDPGSRLGLNGSAEAIGGFGARGAIFSGQGGDATASIVGQATGVGSADMVHVLNAAARPGSGLGTADDGDALAEADGTTGFGTLRVSAEATARRQSAISPASGQGGDATAIARGLHTGTGSLRVEADATVGISSGGVGVGRVEASGIATNGADVEVRATLSSPGPIELRDAVSGSTSGRLSLRQSASGRSSGIARGDSDVVTSLEADNAGGGDLRIDVFASAGQPNGRGVVGGNATIESVVGTTDGDVVVRGVASGGAGAEGRIDSLVGISTGGGSVFVAAEVWSQAPEGLLVDNVVDGETSGALSLSQRATFSEASPSSEPVAASYDAESRLNRVGSFDSLTLQSEAVGFRARASAEGENDAGDLVVEAMAIGANGSSSSLGSSRSLDGGQASTRAVGRSAGDGQRVQVGRRYGNAVGGNGVVAIGGMAVGDGGNASSESEGAATGDSEVAVVGVATGGTGGGFRGNSGDLAGGRGGDANASAWASNAGTSEVRAEAIATGGLGGRGFGVDNESGRGGDATASARGESTGGADVFVRAEAWGGTGGRAGSANELAGRGGNASIGDLSGSTAGTLRLEARVAAGQGGQDMDRRFRGSAQGGDAAISIDAINEGGGALEIDATATTRFGGSLIVGPVRGRSTTGADVSVSLNLNGAGARIVGDGVTAPGMDESIRLENVVDGETEGVLRLNQVVSGGTGDGSVENLIERVGSQAGLGLRSRTDSEGGGAGISTARSENDAGWASAEAEVGAQGDRAIATTEALGTGDGETLARSTSNLYFATSDAIEAISRSHAISQGGGRTDAASSVFVSRSADSTATAYAENAGLGDVVAFAGVDNEPGAIGEPGAFTVDAEAHSLGGGDVFVEVNVNRRGSYGLAPSQLTALHDVVRGSTSGALSLSQRVLSDLGDVSTSLVSENTGGGDLTLFVDASSLRRGLELPDGFALSDGGRVLLGDVVGRSNTGRNVDIFVRALGNEIVRERRDQPGKASRIRGESKGGGDVSVRAEFGIVAAAGETETEGQVLGDSGRSISLDNVVGGDTTGRLVLGQQAEAARGADVGLSFTTLPNVIAGDGGEARSRLTQNGFFESLELDTSALGGAGGASYAEQSENARAGAGGDGFSEIEAMNREGSIKTGSLGRGGQGGFSARTAGDGGNGYVAVSATTIVDGASIEVGGPRVLNRETGAIGGDGASPSYSATDSSLAGDGGDGESRSSGRAAGNSSVQVYDSAQGGRGGEGRRFRSGGGGGDGGRASSAAFAAGGGVERVFARSEAIGGDGGLYLAAGEASGGGASATSSAKGSGLAESIAIARGGVAGSYSGVFGDASSTASAVGARALAQADASSGIGGETSVRASVRREGAFTSAVEAFASGANTGVASGLDFDGSAFVTGTPNVDAIASARLRHVGLDSLLSDPSANASIRALGSWSASGAKGTGVTQTVEIDITLQAVDLRREVLLAVFEEDAFAGGFDQMTFSLERYGERVGEEQTFSSLDQANAYFAELIGLGFLIPEAPPLSGPLAWPADQPPAIRAIFEIASSGKQRVSFGIAAVVVPEPSTALLVGLGLAGLAARARRRPPASA